jgi:hypothetical protein
MVEKIQLMLLGRDVVKGSQLGGDVGWHGNGPGMKGGGSQPTRFIPRPNLDILLIGIAS